VVHIRDDLLLESHAELAAGVPGGQIDQCTSCGYSLDVGSTQHLPPCPQCGNGQCNTKSGGDAAEDPYPDR
jgi:hypothetical protein